MKNLRYSYRYVGKYEEKNVNTAHNQVQAENLAYLQNDYSIVYCKLEDTSNKDE